ncbi:TPA: AbiJ-NTD4 domain-containing protein, partial [Legionella pneumophila]|nr:hypothetical protein [Legionella pneumophila]HEN4778819.1 hypothetical protein [Legionella pneumophila]
MNFSQREGYKDISLSPFEGMSTGLKNAIFNEIHSVINEFISLGMTGYGDSSYKGKNAELLWTVFFEKKKSILPYAGDFLKEFESLYDSLKWYEIYDLIEYLITLSNLRNDLIEVKFNQLFEKYNSPYRLINKVVQPISSEETIAMINTAFENAPTQESKQHLENAEKHYSRKQDPDFNNSCLESIKAIESCLRSKFKNKDNLGDNIKKLRGASYNQHIVSIIDKINAFRGHDSAHATKPDGYKPTREDAILIHSICCSFINYF